MSTSNRGSGTGSACQASAISGNARANWSLRATVTVLTPPRYGFPTAAALRCPHPGRPGGRRADRVNGPGDQVIIDRPVAATCYVPRETASASRRG
ncbi:hypothetical protein GCM10010484_60770 [Actinokineospora globicatena]